jgi:hypothetical protein
MLESHEGKGMTVLSLLPFEEGISLKLERIDINTTGIEARRFLSSTVIYSDMSYPEHRIDGKIIG